MGTGGCDTKDPTGQQHHCCSDTDGGKYCPTATYLKSLTDVELWAEGAEGNFHLEIDYIGAVDKVEPATVCKVTEYCCPDAKKCLTPTSTSCLTDDACGDGQVCC